MKILLLAAATGGGHLRAAQAVEQYIRENTPHEVVLVDALKAVNRHLDKLVCGSYLFMAKKTPATFGRLYKRTNRKSTLSDLIPRLNGLFRKRLYHAIASHQPDAIITTHAFATEMVSELKKDGLLTVPLVGIVTDYGAHRAYIAPRVDAYVVACEDMVAELAALGVEKSRVHPFGIPVHGQFFLREDRAALRQQLGLQPDLPTLLFMAGSFGVSNIIQLYRDLSAADAHIQIAVITGRNKKLYEAFQAELKAGARIPTQLVFFTGEVEKYMHAADLLVTKPGGLTVSEALASNLPMALFDAIPGQEEDNARFLETNGMCVRLRKGDSFGKTISSLLTDDARLGEMRARCAQFDKSQSVPNMLAVIEELLAAGTGPHT